MSFIVKAYEIYRRQQKEKYGSMDQIFSLYKLNYDGETKSYLVSICFVHCRSQ